MSNKIIEVKELSFFYQKENPILQSINIDIYKNETIGVIGANGAGKSTLLKLLVGLLEANSGIITIDGQKLNSKSIKDIRRKIGYTFQDADSQLFMTTVYEDIAFAPRNYGMDEDDVDKVVKRSLNKVNALNLLDRPPYKLSGGEKRLVTIATVLAMNPDIIIFDEPSVGLDPKSRRNLINILNNLDKTKIIATHDMDMALDICDRVIVLHNGRIESIGTPESIFVDESLLKKCNLELPLSIQGCRKCHFNKI